MDELQRLREQNELLSGALRTIHLKYLISSENIEIIAWHMSEIARDTLEKAKEVSR